MKTNLIIVLAVAGAALAALLGLPLIRTALAPQPVQVSFTGITNGTIGTVSGRWAMYTATNLTSDPLALAGVKLEVKGSQGWQLDPALKLANAGNYLVPPTLVWHDAINATLAAHGTAHFFFRERADSGPWRASLRFLHRRPSRAPASLRADPSIPAALAEAAVGYFDAEHPCECPVPQPSQ